MWNQIIRLLFPAFLCTTFLFSTACGTTAQDRGRVYHLGELGRLAAFEYSAS